MTNTIKTSDITLSLHTLNGKTVPAVTSLQVAEAFGKRHDHVLRDIADLLSQTPEIFVEPNFGEYEAEYFTGFGMKKTPAYLLSKDGFTLLTMGYTGERAMRFKVAYIQRFNEMEAELARRERIPADPTALGLPDFRDPVEAAQAWAREVEGRREAEGKLALAEPKAAVYDAVVADKILSLRDFCRRLTGVNLNRVKHSLLKAGVLYVGTDGSHRVYARYRDTHFIEKFDKDYGSLSILVLEEGQKLLARLYDEGRLELKKGFRHVAA